MDKDGDLSGRTGAVLDPVFALRVPVSIPAGQSVQVTFTTFMADTRNAAVDSATMYSDARRVGDSFENAGSTTESSSDAAVYHELAGHLLFPPIRSHSRPLDADLDLAGLTSLPLSGAPIVLTTARNEAGLKTVRSLVEMHGYWERKGISTDLVIIADDSVADLDELKAYEGGAGELAVSEGGRIVLRRFNEVSQNALDALRAVARISVECIGQSLADVVRAMDITSTSSAVQSAHKPRATNDFSAEATSRHGGHGDGLDYFNGIGGFNDADEYEIRLSGEILPPAPWINVIANELGGFIVSETGSGATWAISSSSFRLTPWQNDPVTDRPGECIYIRDEESGDVWTPTAAPIREVTPYTVRHGAGYSIFEHAHGDIESSLRVGVPQVDTVKLQVLEMTNRATRPRSLIITSYAEWVLGTDRESTRLHIDTSLDSGSGVVLARNQLNPEFADVFAFCAVSEPLTAHTLSRTGFFGRNGSYDSPKEFPSGARRGDSRGSTDPCAALEMRIEIPPGESRSLVIALGAARGRAEAAAMAERYRSVEKANAALDDAVAAWRSRLDTIVVRTPEPSFDLMLNQWALYQALSCRVWGRTALYQSSGAYGFRDQLQDVMAFTYAEPSLAREQIIRAASRQFEEGDVQHWWHPHSGRGVRTRFADDLIWLSFVVDHYLRVTHDSSVLDERTHYLRMRTLEPGDEEIYAVPDVSDRTATVFDHCVHALDRACTAGEHGLPLMASGDWNDGMNRVGVHGKGESVWLAWFLITTLRGFADHAAARGNVEIAEDLRKKAEKYREAVERAAWDGEWYRRAYYDDGAPLGSHVNEECSIDSIAQSWSVISKAGDPERARIAMQSLNKHLVREDARLLMLLTPPFDRGSHDPGYIQGYLPGVRENGAQYTHAALWAVLATALQGDGNRAMELYQMINPITHAASADDAATYKVEPYVVAADVYTAEGHLGRGGWTWYTGSASWLYRVGLEAILGFTKRGKKLDINPCIPSSWKGFSLDYRFGKTLYRIEISNPSGVESGVSAVTVDGVLASSIDLADDGQAHAVRVTMGSVSA
jgi:cyclic beta-1,2-glucan synthetase